MAFVYDAIMITTISVLFLLLLLVGMGYCKIHFFRIALQKKLSAVEWTVALVDARLDRLEKAQALVDARLDRLEKAQEENLTQDQIDFRDKLQAQYESVFQQIQDRMAQELKAVRSEANELVKKSRAETNDSVKSNQVEFAKKLKEEFDKACEQIKFDEIEYKKVITKKRQEYNRKNSHKAKPQRIWRYIDEE